MLSFNDLLSVRSDANHRNMAIAELFKSFDILLAGIGQFVKTTASRNIIVKALESFVNRRAVCKFFKRCREILNNSTVRLLVGNAYLKIAYTAECVSSLLIASEESPFTLTE